MGLIILFNCRKSTQKRLDPSFLSTTTTGKLHGDLDLRMIPASNISSMPLSITALLFNGVLYGFILIGGCSPVSNCIFTVSVCPNFASVCAKKNPGSPSPVS